VVGVCQDYLHPAGQQFLWGDSFHGRLCPHRHEHGGREHPMGGGDAAEAGLCSCIVSENVKAEWHRRLLRSTGSVTSHAGLPPVRVAMSLNNFPLGSKSIHSGDRLWQAMGMGPGTTAAPMRGHPPPGGHERWDGRSRSQRVSTLLERLKPGVFLEERQVNLAGWTVTLFPDDDFGDALILGFPVIDLLAVDEYDEVRILLDSSGFTQVRQLRYPITPLLHGPAELGERDHWDLEF